MYMYVSRDAVDEQVSDADSMGLTPIIFILAYLLNTSFQ